MKEWLNELKLVLIVLAIVLIVLALERYFDSCLTDQERIERMQEQIKNSRKFDT